MKREILLTMAALLCFSLLIPRVAAGQATIWVSNVQDQVVVDYTSLQTAINNAAPGDTIMVYPSQANYGNVTISKPLHLIGVGYNIDTASQPGLQIEAFAHHATIGSITVNTGSGGGSIHSLRISSISIANVTDYEISRSYFDALKAVDCSQFRIVSNYIGSGAFTSEPWCSNINNKLRYNMVFENMDDLLLSNNIFNMYHTHNFCYSDLKNLYIDPDCNNVYVKNNIFRDDLSANHTIFRNNIFFYSPGCLDCVVEYNVFDSGGTYPNNTYNVDVNLLFAGYPTQGQYSFDSRYQLAAGSPAAGAGLNGVDCGAFGGITPYKLSGIDNRPLIYQFSAPAEVPGGQDMDVHIKVRSEN